MVRLFNKQPFKLGELFIKKNYITTDILESALKLQTKCKSKLDSILLAEGVINSEQLYGSLAEQYNLEFINLIEQPCDSSLISVELIQTYIKYQVIPWKREQNTVIIAVSELSNETIKWMEDNFSSYKIVVTSISHIQWNIEKIFCNSNLADSIDHLKDLTPDQSSHFILCMWQKILVFLLVMFTSLSLFFALKTTIVVLFVIINLCYLFSNFFKTVLYIAGLYFNRKKEKKYIFIEDHRLPIYTILLPLFQEKEVLPRLIFSINSLNYPKAKLDIKLIVEEDDLVTITAINDLKCGEHFKIIKVPKSIPRTKPKALNYALRFALGKYLVIYDAEDRPHPNQLREVVSIFAQSPANVICIQGQLSFFNREENLLSKCFTIEYSLLFDIIHAGLYLLNIPIPLGGSSNHFVKDKLELVGKWDPFNVTEDIDISIRMHYHQFSTRLVNSCTLEEAPLTLAAWITQRSRWIKGYILTYLVHMRNPRRLFKSLGLMGFLGVQCFIGLPIICFLTAPIMWISSLSIKNFYGAYYDNPIFNSIHKLWYINLIYCFTLPFLSASMVAICKKWTKMKLACLLFPLYFLLHSIASFRALWYLIIAPSRWDKTKHGVSEYI